MQLSATSVPPIKFWCFTAFIPSQQIKGNLVCGSSSKEVKELYWLSKILKRYVYHDFPYTIQPYFVFQSCKLLLAYDSKEICNTWGF